MTSGLELWNQWCSRTLDGCVKLVTIPHELRDKFDRLNLSNGTVNASKLGLYGYESTAFVPTEPWREPTDLESNALWADEVRGKRSSIVGLVNFSANSLNRIRELILVAEKFKNPNIAIPSIISEVRQVCHLTGESFFSGIFRHSANLVTVTRNSNNNFIGLHLDNFDKLPLYTKIQATNRIAVNIGEDDRFFLLINLTVAGMASCLGIEINSNTSITSEEIGFLFMSRFPDYPVIRLRVAPGEAYIAPTENIIHDGSTLDIENRGINMTIRGFVDIFE